MTATKPELDTIASVVSTLRTGSPAIRRRLVRAVAAVLSSEDGRYLEQVDVHLSELEAAAEDLQAGKTA